MSDYQRGWNDALAGRPRSPPRDRRGYDRYHQGYNAGCKRKASTKYQEGANISHASTT